MTTNARLRVQMAVGARSIPKTAFFLAAGWLFLHLAGCKQQKTEPAPAKSSAIRVQTGSDAIEIKTETAKFVLQTSGYLQADLLNAKGEVTLDEPGSEAGQEVSLANSNETAGD